MNKTSSRIANSGSRMIKAGLMGIVFAPLIGSANAQRIAPAENATPRNAPAAVPFVENTLSAPHKPGTEGISIHGHWVMDVVNRDGTIAAHRDFENALVPSQGGAVLAGMLTGVLVPQTFDVVLAGTGKTALLYVSGQACPQVLASYQGDCSATLAQTLAPGGYSVLLKSTYTPAAALTVSTVSTHIGTCPSTAAANPVSPATCQATTSGPIPGAGGAYVGIYQFTAATIPDLPIAPGQSLVVSVTISFS